MQQYFDLLCHISTFIQNIETIKKINNFEINGLSDRVPRSHKNALYQLLGITQLNKNIVLQSIVLWTVNLPNPTRMIYYFSGVLFFVFFLFARGDIIWILAVFVYQRVTSNPSRSILRPGQLFESRLTLIIVNIYNTRLSLKASILSYYCLTRSYNIQSVTRISISIVNSIQLYYQQLERNFTFLQHKLE